MTGERRSLGFLFPLSSRSVREVHDGLGDLGFREGLYYQGFRRDTHKVCVESPGRRPRPET